MIVQINPDIFHTNRTKELDALAEILNLFVREQGFLLDIGTIINVLYDKETYVFDETSFAKVYLSSHVQGRLKDEIDVIVERDAYITRLHECYLTVVTIGIQEGELPPSLALQLLKLPSKVILENGTNDWRFIKGIVQKHKNHKKRKSIYKLIDKRIKEHYLEPENAGGFGGIKKRIEAFQTNQYQKSLKYKIFALFDSDRFSKTELKNEQKKLIAFIKNKDESDIDINTAMWEEQDQIVWHMLYKRSIENYLPIEQVEAATPELKAMSPEEYDFIKLEDFLDNDIDIKNDFPAIFEEASLNRQDLEERCKHHLNEITLPNETLTDVTELEDILLKIAKII